MSGEDRLWKWLRDRLPGGHYTRIESEVSEGFPDVHGTPRNRRSLTLELKYADGPKRQPLKDKIRLSQKVWIEHEVAAGGLVWVVAEFPKHQGWVLFLPGLYVRDLEDMSFDDIESLADLQLAKRTRPEVTRRIIDDFWMVNARK